MCAIWVLSDTRVEEDNTSLALTSSDCCVKCQTLWGLVSLTRGAYVALCGYLWVFCMYLLVFIGLLQVFVGLCGYLWGFWRYLLGFMGICGSLWIFVGLYGYLWVFVRVCWYLWVFIDNCWYLWVFIDNCWYLCLNLVGLYHHLCITMGSAGLCIGFGIMYFV